MSEEIININDIVQRIRDNLEHIQSQLNIKNLQIKVTSLTGEEIPMSFRLAINKLHTDMINNHSYRDTALNLFKILWFLPEKLNDISENLTFRIEDLINLIDALTSTNRELSAENEDLKKTNEKLVQRLDAMERERLITENEELKQKLQQLETTPEMLQKQKFVDELFTSPIQTPLDEDGDSYTYDNSEDESADKKKIGEINKLHTEVLDILRSQDLYPLHKVDIERAKTEYLGAWELSLPRYDSLSEDDYPQFINNLEEYEDKPDDYLDTVSTSNGGV